MKKLILILAITVGLMLVACEKEDQEPKPLPPPPTNGDVPPDTNGDVPPPPPPPPPEPVDLDNTCASQGGDKCEAGEGCEGEIIDAVDSFSCCSKTCVTREKKSFDTIDFGDDNPAMGSVGG
ncbi:hypothetical protein ACFLZX_04710 [Nanoarchaeota archaeon]